MNLFDTHAHYNDEKFDEDREEIIRNTFISGISEFVVAGYSIDSSKKALEIVEKHDNCYAIVGISPNNLEDIKSENDIKLNIKEVEKIASNGRVVGIGEIGLDYYWNKEKKELQQKVFIEQIKLANKLDKPIIIHTREAIYDTLEIIKNNEVTKRGIFHCCPLNRELVKEAIKLGYYISLSGIITFKNAKNADEIIKLIPEDKLLIETDSPYLSPEPLRGSRNTCINVKYVANKIAITKNRTLEEIAEITNKNAKRIFDIK